jgi:SAM-dependent methyltransferase
MTKVPFLELGASAVPHRNATHAVDRDSKKQTIKWIREEYTENSNTPITLSQFEHRLKQMDYKFRFNYNTQKFPWPNNSFKTVYSTASLGNYGGNVLHAFKESYRVLKHGGQIKFDVIGTKQHIIKIKELLIKSGFGSILIKKNGKPISYEGKIKYPVKIAAIKP